MKALLRALVLSLLASAYAPPALAWVDSTLRGSETTITVDPSGRAEVVQQLFVHVNGGVLTSFELVGIDRDAEGLSATVARATGELRSPPIPLAVELAGDTLAMRVLPPTKLSRGSLVFEVSYQADLEPMALGTDPVTQSERIELGWVGPRFVDGVDSVRVRFRVPRRDPEPTLPTERPSSDWSGEYDGVFFSTLHRDSQQDVIELVRPHVARGEPVVWRVWVAPEILALPPRATAARIVPEAVPTPPVATENVPTPSRPGLGYAAAAFAMTLIFGFVLFVKDRAVTEAARRRGMTARPLLPLSLELRWLLGVVSMSLAAVLLGSARLAALAAGPLLVAMLAATHLAPRLLPVVRGPGVWKERPFGGTTNALPLGREPGLPGGWLDARQPLGLGGFALLSVMLWWGSKVLFVHDRYEAAVLLVSGVLWVPIFFTGTRTMLLRTPAELQGVLKRVGRRLQSEGYSVTWLTRVPLAASDADELRLLITTCEHPAGFEGMELGFEQYLSPLGVYESAAVILRVVDGSPCHEGFPRQLGAQPVVWERGRSSDQRVTVFRPNLASVADTVRLVMTIRLGMAVGQSSLPAASVKRSRGSSELTRKPGTCSLPAQAT